MNRIASDKDLSNPLSMRHTEKEKPQGLQQSLRFMILLGQLVVIMEKVWPLSAK